MKKYFFMACIALATVVMTSCEKKPEPQPQPESVKITLSQKAVELGVGDEIRLRTSVTPAGTQLNIVFKSSDESVASVTGSGLVTAIAEGEALIIASAEGAISDTCVVSVTDMAIYNNFNVAGYVFLSYEGEETEMIPGTDTILSLSFGDAVCQLGYFHFFGYDGDVVWMNNAGWVGDGYTICFDVPVYIIVDDQLDGRYNGYYISFNGAYYAALPIDKSEVDLFEGVAGKLDAASYGDWVSYFYSNDTTAQIDRDAIKEKTYGAFLGEVYTSPSTGQARNYFNYDLYAGHVNKFVYFDPVQNAARTEDSIPARWAIDLDWAAMDADRLWGYRIDTALYAETYVEGQGGQIELIKPYDYKTINRVFDEEGIFSSQSEAPARMQAKKKDREYFLGDMSKILIINRETKQAVRASERLYKK